MIADVHSLATETRSPVSAVCRALDLPRSTVYARRDRLPCQRAKDNEALDVEIAAIHAESKRRYGSPRIHRALRRRGRKVSRKRVEARMRHQKLWGRRPRRFRRTTVADEKHAAIPNVLDRRFQWPEPNQAWVGDITYLWTREGWVYLAILVDLCTRVIVGWATSRHCDAALALTCLDVAVSRHSPSKGMILHHDRGCTYTAEDYQNEITRLGGVPSMSRKGNCWDNAVAESTFATIKIELFMDFIPDGKEHADRELLNYIEIFYNRIRLHSALGYITPAEKEMLALQESLAA